MELKIEYVDIDSITPSDRNAKQHPAEQITEQDMWEQIS